MKDRNTEINEAIAAADAALIHLDGAYDYLKSAGNWGIVDILGGGFIATMIKRGKMRDAEAEMSAARAAVQRLAKEVRDVDEVMDLHLEMDGFLGFADFFFDGAIADWLVRSRISTARNQVKEATDMVMNLRAALSDLLREQTL